jgi:hypothetical protein
MYLLLLFILLLGSFNTCDICNNANDLLKDTGKRFTKAQREVVLKYKKLHIDQQAAERAYLEQKRLECQQLDVNGQPIAAMIYSDGMTVFRGNTPKYGKLRHSKGVQYMTNRVIGVEVVCGPVNSVFLYHTDQLVGGGANILIEVTRQGIIVNYYII